MDWFVFSSAMYDHRAARARRTSRNSPFTTPFLPWQGAAFNSYVYSISYCQFIHIGIFVCVYIVHNLLCASLLFLVMISVFSIPPQPQNTPRPTSSLLFLPRNYRTLLVILFVVFFSFVSFLSRPWLLLLLLLLLLNPKRPIIAVFWAQTLAL